MYFFFLCWKKEHRYEKCFTYSHLHVLFFFQGKAKAEKLHKYYHRGSNWGSSTRGTALTRYVFIGCCDSGNNPDSNACQNTWRKYIWTPLKIGPGLVMWWSMNNQCIFDPFALCKKQTDFSSGVTPFFAFFSLFLFLNNNKQKMLVWHTFRKSLLCIFFFHPSSFHTQSSVQNYTWRKCSLSAFTLVFLKKKSHVV